MIALGTVKRRQCGKYRHSPAFPRIFIKMQVQNLYKDTVKYYDVLSVSPKPCDK
jgi:hypothetical protein